MMKKRRNPVWLVEGFCPCFLGSILKVEVCLKKKGGEGLTNKIRWVLVTSYCIIIAKGSNLYNGIFQQSSSLPARFELPCQFGRDSDCHFSLLRPQFIMYSRSA